jgi:hypothetical protein
VAGFNDMSETKGDFFPWSTNARAWQFPVR